MAPHQQGFDESLLMASGLYLPEDHPGVVNAKLDFDPIDQFLWSALSYASSFNSGNDDRFEPSGYLTDYWTDESIKVIKANRNRHFSSIWLTGGFIHPYRRPAPTMKR